MSGALGVSEDHVSVILYLRPALATLVQDRADRLGVPSHTMLSTVLSQMIDASPRVTSRGAAHGGAAPAMRDVSRYRRKVIQLSRPRYIAVAAKASSLGLTAGRILELMVERMILGAPTGPVVRVEVPVVEPVRAPRREPAAPRLQTTVPRGYHRMTVEKAGELERLRRVGAPHAQIATELGVSLGSVANWSRKTAGQIAGTALACRWCGADAKGSAYLQPDHTYPDSSCGYHGFHFAPVGHVV